MRSQGERENQFAERVADDLEPYRRLIELQKQMIELVRQHEKTKQECTVLRDRLLEEMTQPRRWPWSRRRATRRLKSFSAPDWTGSAWTRNWKVLLLLPAKQPAAAKSTRPASPNFNP